MDITFEQVNKGAVQLALERQLFGRYTTLESEPAIGTIGIVILQNNPERIAWTMVNTGSTEITFRLSQEIISGVGLILPANGDTVSTNYLEDAQYTTHEVTAISSAAGGSVFLTEFIRYGI